VRAGGGASRLAAAGSASVPGRTLITPSSGAATRASGARPASSVTATRWHASETEHDRSNRRPRPGALFRRLRCKELGNGLGNESAQESGDELDNNLEDLSLTDNLAFRSGKFRSLDQHAACRLLPHRQ